LIFHWEEVVLPFAFRSGCLIGSILKFEMDGMDEGGGMRSAEEIFGMFGGGGGIFNMFGGGAGGGRGRRRRKGEDTIQSLVLSLEDLYKGKTSKLQLTKKVICSDCNGRGGKDGTAVKECQRCRGQGRVLLTRQVGPGMLQQMQTRCDSCSGEGTMIDDKDKCRRCNGRKTVQEQKIIEVIVTPGMRDGQKIVFYSEGDQEPDIEPGDVILVIKTKPHEVFQRKGDDLIMKQKITLNEALCGFTGLVKHLDGRDIVIKNRPGQVLKPDSLRCVIGEGMPIKNSAERGNLYIIFEVVFPENHFLPEDGFKKLEALLPARPTENINGDVEEVSLSEYEDRRHDHGRAGRREAYHDDYGSDEEMHGGGQRVQCASQ